MTQIIVVATSSRYVSRGGSHSPSPSLSSTNYLVSSGCNMFEILRAALCWFLQQNAATGLATALVRRYGSHWDRDQGCFAVALPRRGSPRRGIRIRPSYQKWLYITVRCFAHREWGLDYCFLGRKQRTKHELGSIQQQAGQQEACSCRSQAILKYKAAPYFFYGTWAMARRANSTLNLSPVKVLYLPEQKASHSSCGVPCGEPGEGGLWGGVIGGRGGDAYLLLSRDLRWRYFHGNAN